MDLNKLRIPDLLLVLEALGGSAGQAKRKPHIIELIREIGADDEELTECWELIQERKRDEEHEKQMLSEKEKREQELDLKELELERLRLEAARAGRSLVSVEREKFKIKDLVQPYKLGEDIGLFLVNFERTCERVGFDRETWPENLLTLLPFEAADIIARLSKDTEDYDKVKSALLKKYRLSIDAFRQRFRNSVKKTDVSFPEFAYTLNTNLIEWLKCAEVYEDHDKVVECIALEQFYKCVPESAMFWIQDRLDVVSVQTAAELAEEYATRRNLQGTNGSKWGKKENARERKWQEKNRMERRSPHRGLRGKSQTNEREGGSESGGVPPNGQNNAKPALITTKAFEARKPEVCWTCGEGHYAANCSSKPVYSCVGNSAEDAKLLEPYSREMTINGKPCRVLRDLAATVDVVHPSFVATSDYTGECATVKQVIGEHRVCLPLARVTVEGPFGWLETDAEVSRNLSPSYLYLFSNKSEQLLQNRGQSFAAEMVLALARSKTRELASDMEYDDPKDERSETEAGTAPEIADATNANDAKRANDDECVVDESTSEAKGNAIEELLTSVSRNFENLEEADRETLADEQQSSPPLHDSVHDSSKEGVAGKNISLFTKSGLLYWRYRDKRESLDQYADGLSRGF